jgi:uncharacterized protein YhaN
MRIARLDLLRYGMFTDRSIALPHRSVDFHMICGPNEAGKSTLRSAILDLLFGIETRSTYNFLHPHSEMRLGAKIEHDGKALDFSRTKARTRSLLNPSGTPLPDNVLAAFLGSTDRKFFDEMFGLDHEKLVAGGNEILNASNDIGQILFQSAAGIGSLGEVRDALEAEADGLWARRKSVDRSYYAASDELAIADAALKQATVRTKDWVAARAVVARLEEQLEDSRKQYRKLEETRIRLEGVRRVAPILNTLREKERELVELGEVTVLPPNAEKQLIEAEIELAKAGQEHTLFAEQVEAIQGQLAKIQLNERLLNSEADIQALTERRQQVRNHESDIVKRKLEINGHLQNIESLIRQLGWPAAGEEDLQLKLPGIPLRTAIASLIRGHGVLAQALSTAEQAVRDKDIELRSIEEEIKGLPNTSMSASLRSALSLARGLGDVDALDRRLNSQLASARRKLKVAQAELGQWNVELEILQKLELPSSQEIDEMRQRQTISDASATALSERAAELRSSINDLELDITQYRDVHHPVTLAELSGVRGTRDAVWLSIKSGAALLAEAAPGYEAKVQVADGLSDKRHDKAQEVSELQAKQDSLQRLQQQAIELKQRIAANCNEQLAMQAEWARRADKIGLPGMPLLAMGAWREARDTVLSAAAAVEDAESALDELTRKATEAKSALSTALADEAIEAAATETLGAMIVAASDAVESATKMKVRREELEKQRRSAVTAKATLQDKATAAGRALKVWETSWRENVARAGLDVETDVGTAEGALGLFASVEKALAAIQELRKTRIETMQRDLQDFENEAAALPNLVAPDLKGKSPTEIESEMARRLVLAKSDKKEWERLSKELLSAQAKCADALARLSATTAGIQPLLNLSKASTNEALRVAITRSDQWRVLSEAVVSAKETVQDGSDGLTREALEVELQSTDVPAIPVTLSEIGRQRDEVLGQQNALSAELANANTELSKIAGQDQAARAESARQDALAKMANAAERYIKVFTAARLLRWAIDRYRETKQGPLLTRAGEIFSGLTLGSFKKLAVDFESEPLALEGQRSDGKLVGILGMSDGTRDQLYLALRMAALELHLAQAQSLPFIADDLFINYDDARANAGLIALADLAKKTQVIFLSHHDHLVPAVRSVFGARVNVVGL